MRVDRQKFLVAVAAMAAACGAQAPTSTVTVAIPARPVESNDGTARPAPIGPSSVPIAPASEDAPRPLATAPPAPTPEGTVAPASEGVAPASEGSVTPSGDDGAQCHGKKVARPRVCDDDHGNPRECKAAFCREGFVCEHCDDYRRYFKPKIAERAVACVLAQSPREARDGCRTYQCGDEALAGACIDPSVDATCSAVARSCKTTMDSCRGLLSGMNAAGRANIAACAAKGCPYGLWSCVEGI